MSKPIRSVKGLFGQTIHYRDGIKIGESLPGLFEGSQNHYGADGKFVGYSDHGFFADQVHRDAYGSCVGTPYEGLFGRKKHYSARHGYAGETWDTFTGEKTELLAYDSKDSFEEKPDVFSSRSGFGALFEDESDDLFTQNDFEDPFGDE